ncbi:MAG: hypothetical protein ACYC6M_02960 [Terriglobales bacterium]
MARKPSIKSLLAGEVPPAAQTWEHRYYAQLVGKTVARVVIDGSNRWPIIGFTDGTEVVVQCDPEGNGPGFLMGLPQPKEVR